MRSLRLFCPNAFVSAEKKSQCAKSRLAVCARGLEITHRRPGSLDALQDAMGQSSRGRR